MIPILNVRDKSCACAWEKSLQTLFYRGCSINTQYDGKNHLPSIDSTMIITIDDPLSEPMLHREIPGGLGDLQEYVMEVCDGLKDGWVDNNDENKWQYTYHGRLTNYDGINQIEKMIRLLCKFPYTRRAQAITWKVASDLNINDPPCLQSIWMRIYEDKLCTNIRIRSNDAFKAAMMNIFAFTILIKNIAEEISYRTKKDISVGRLCWMADSYHIYGKDIDEFKNRFLKLLSSRPLKQRVFNYKDVKDIMEEYNNEILNKIKLYNERRI